MTGLSSEKVIVEMRNVEEFSQIWSIGALGAFGAIAAHQTIQMKPQSGPSSHLM